MSGGNVGTEGEELPPMSSLSKEEFWDVYRVFKPAATWAEYEVAWDDFIKCREEHYRKKALS